MVTIEDISMEITRPAKNLAEWHYPFSQTLETYYSLYNDTSNTSKNFSNAGLVIQNSIAVYIHRIDCLWKQTTLIRNVFLNHEENIQKEKDKVYKKGDRNIDINLETFNFANEIDKNIDIKKSIMQESVKSKSRCFTQLEKGITSYIPIDIYDINGEVIGKKYAFRCNQDINMNGMLIDEFAPEDFDCSNDNSVQERSMSPRHSPNTTAHDNSDAECEINDNDSPEESSDCIDSLDSSKNLSSSTGSAVDTLNSSTAGTTYSSLTDTLHDQSFIDVTKESQCTSSSDTNLLNNTTDNSVVLNNNTDAPSLNNNIETSVHDGNDQLDNTIKSINSQKRTPSIFSEEANKDAELLQSPLQATRMFQEDLSVCLNYIRKYNPLQYDDVINAASDFLGFRLSATKSCNTMNGDTYKNVTLTSTKNEKMLELCSPPRISIRTSTRSLKGKYKGRIFIPKTPKKRRFKKFLGKGRDSLSAIRSRDPSHLVKNLLNELQKESLMSECIVEGTETDKLNMFQQNLNACTKYIQEYDPLQYDHMTDAASNFLGFQLHVVEATQCDSIRHNAEDNVVADLDIDNTVELHYSPCHFVFSEEENSCDPWLQSDSPDFLQKNIDKWHELLQDKLREAEQRSTFSVCHYTSRMMERLRSSSQRQINFSDIIPREESSDMARYFLASLHLASRQKVDLIRSTDVGHNLQITLYDGNTSHPRNDQADSHD